VATLSTLPAFLVAVVLIWSAPGPALLLVLRRAAVRGARPALATVAGLGSGVLAWALVVAAGLGALVAASELAYVVLRVVGAVVLVLLGVRALLGVLRERRAGLRYAVDSDPDLSGGGARGARGAFLEGLVVNLGNPKAAMFAVAFYPQFVPAGAPVFSTTALLGVVQLTVETGLYVVVLAVISRARSWLNRSAVRRWLDTVSGSVLIGLGLRVATTTR
jgi:threonine/homoserine/homoserine lactone efflux protein